MALRDTLRNLIGIPENDYDNDYDDEMQSGNIDQQEEEQTSMASPSSDRKHNKVVNIHATTQLAVVLVKPERYEDAASIADHLNAKKTVVLNLEGIDVEVAQRIIDFSSGACYSINGSLQKVSSYIFILTPASVEISGDIQDILNGAIPSIRTEF